MDEQARAARAAEASGAEQGEKCDAKQLRNMRDAQELDGESRNMGPSLSHLHPPVCLSN